MRLSLLLILIISGLVGDFRGTQGTTDDKDQ